ncbi:MAG: DUF1214 domain-containing protein [Alphaproteobacteria bacterium]|nr:DUF1214 domain-containing protein [Alphaproteobacteria bacterium]
MGFVLRLFGALATAIGLGLGSAYVAINVTIGGRTAAVNGAWATSLATGGTSADNYTRAYVAITGLLALNKDETIYYTATKDSAGARLEGNCTYRIEGRDPDARWWSITLYGNDHYLIDNPANRYSVSQNSVVRAADGTFVIRLSTVEEPGNWIATSPDGFDVTLRLYNPGDSIRDNPATAQLPTITREVCT